MALQNDTSRIQYNGNNSTSSSYAIPFVFFENAHIRCVVTNSSSVDTELTLGSTFNVTGAGNANGGSLTTTTAVPTSSKVTIFREVPATQTTSYQEGGDFPAESHERALDKLTMIAQQTKRLADRALKVPETQNNPNDLPNASAGSKLLGSNNGTLNWEENRQLPAYPLTVGTNALVSAGSGSAPSWQTLPSISPGPITATGSTEPRYLGDRFADALNVKDFGADVTGLTDSSTAIQNAINAAQDGATIIFPFGTYLIGTTLNIPVNKSRITLKGLGGTLKASSGEMAQFLRVIGNFCTITDIHFDGSYVDGVTTDKTTYAAVVAGGTNSALNIYAVEISGHNCTVQNCRFVNVMARAIWVTAGTGTGGDYGIGPVKTVSGTRIHNNLFQNCYNGILINSTIVSSLSPIDGTGFVITNNILENNQWEEKGSIARSIGIGQFANCPGLQNIIIANNILKNAGTTGIELFGEHRFVSVNGNSVEGGDIALSMGGADRVTVANNVLVGARDYQCELALTNHATVVGNYCDPQKSNGTFPAATETKWDGTNGPNFLNGISISGAQICRYVTISGNVCKNCNQAMFGNAVMLESSIVGNVFHSRSATNTTVVSLQASTYRNIVFSHNVLDAVDSVTNGVRIGASPSPPPAAWASGVAYSETNLVAQGGNNYVCLEGHTSSVFATDLANGKWLLSTTSNVIVKDNIVSGGPERGLPIILDNAHFAETSPVLPCSPEYNATTLTGDFAFASNVWPNWAAVNRGGMSHSLEIPASTLSGYAKASIGSFNHLAGSAAGMPAKSGWMFSSMLASRGETGMTTEFYFGTDGTETGGPLTQRALRVSIVGTGSGHNVTAAIHDGTAEVSDTGSITANECRYIVIRWAPIGGNTPSGGSSLAVYIGGPTGITRLVAKATLASSLGGVLFAGNTMSIVASSAATSPSYTTHFEIGGMKWKPSL